MLLPFPTCSRNVTSLFVALSFALAGVSSGQTEAVDMICPAVKAGKKAGKEEKRAASLRKQLEAIAKGGNINATDKNGQTALMFAAATGNDLAACWLVAKGADVTLKTKSGKTAADYAKTDVLREMLEICADWNSTSEDAQKKRQDYLWAPILRYVMTPPDLSITNMTRFVKEYGLPITHIALLARDGVDVNPFGVSFHYTAEDMKLLLALGFKTEGLDEKDSLLLAFHVNDIDTIKSMLKAKPELVNDGYASWWGPVCNSAEAARALYEVCEKKPIIEEWRWEYAWDDFKPAVLPVILEYNKDIFDHDPSPLAMWIGRGDGAAKRADALIKAGFNKEKDINAALTGGVRFKSVEVLEAALAAGAKVKGSSVMCWLFKRGERDYQGVFDDHQETFIPAIAKKLISLGADMNVTDENGKTPLHNAMHLLGPEGGNDKKIPGVVDGIIEGIRLLVTAGAKVPKDILAEIPINPQYGPDNKRLAEDVTLEQWNELAKLMLDHGADPTAKTADGKTALMVLALMDPSLVKRALDAGADPKAADKDGNTALHNATSPETIEMLVKAGADVNAVDKKGNTPLIMLVQTNPPHKTVELLVKAGADVNAADQWGRTPFMELVQKDPTLETMEMLVKAGAKVNAADKQGRTPLMTLAWKDPSLVKCVLEAGADAKAADKERNTALHNASTLETVEMLMKAGADVNVANIKGRTPLMEIARKNFSPKAVEILLKAGADVKAVDQWGRTPFIELAQSNPTLETMELFLKAGSDVNAADKQGRTPLMALAEKDPALVKRALEAGADPKATDNNGTTALHYAVTAEAVEMLVKAGADVNAVNRSGRTPLHWGTRTDDVKNALIKAGADPNQK